MGRINVDIDILEGTNPYFLSIIDPSVCGNLSGNKAIIKITLPGYSEYSEHYFSKDSINIFNAFNLKILCAETCIDCDYVNLPDGIYIISVESETNCNFDVTKKYLRTLELELKLDQLIIGNIACEEFDESKDALITEIEFLIKAAKANIRYDNIQEANNLYRRALKLVNKTC